MINGADTAFILAAAGLGAASGAIAGLAAITPAAGFVAPDSAIIIGLIASMVCFLAVSMKSKLGYDENPAYDSGNAADRGK